MCAAASDDYSERWRAAKLLRKLGYRVPSFKGMSSTRKEATKTDGSLLFGADIEHQPQKPSHLVQGVTVPWFLEESIRLLLARASTEGLFRKSGSCARQRQLKGSLEKSESLEGAASVLASATVHDVAGLLKQWFQELPKPLLPTPLVHLLCRCKEKHGIEVLLLALHIMPGGHLDCLRHLLVGLSQIAADPVSRMEPYNLAVVLAPTLCGAPSAKAASSTRCRKELERQVSLIVTLINVSHLVGSAPVPLSDPEVTRKTTLGTLANKLRRLLIRRKKRRCETVPDSSEPEVPAGSKPRERRHLLPRGRLPWKRTKGSSQRAGTAAGTAAPSKPEFAAILDSSANSAVAMEASSVASPAFRNVSRNSSAPPGTSVSHPYGVQEQTGTPCTSTSYPDQTPSRDMSGTLLCLERRASREDELGATRKQEKQYQKQPEDQGAYFSPELFVKAPGGGRQPLQVEDGNHTSTTDTYVPASAIPPRTAAELLEPDGPSNSTHQQEALEEPARLLCSTNATSSTTRDIQRSGPNSLRSEDPSPRPGRRGAVTKRHYSTGSRSLPPVGKENKEYRHSPTLTTTSVINAPAMSHRYDVKSPGSMFISELAFTPSASRADGCSPNLQEASIKVQQSKFKPRLEASPLTSVKEEHKKERDGRSSENTPEVAMNVGITESKAGEIIAEKACTPCSQTKFFAAAKFESTQKEMKEVAPKKIASGPMSPAPCKNFAVRLQRPPEPRDTAICGSILQMRKREPGMFRSNVIALNSAVAEACEKRVETRSHPKADLCKPSATRQPLRETNSPLHSPLQPMNRKQRDWQNWQNKL